MPNNHDKRLLGTPMDPRDVDEVSKLRVPPHSVEGEQSVLGGLLLDNEAGDRVGDLLNDSDFYRHEHRLIYGATMALIAAMKPADVLTVHEKLRAMGKADECGGLVYLNALAQSVPNAANIRRYAEIVRERSVRRGIIAAADEAATLGFRDDGDVADKLDRVAAMFADLQGHHVRSIPEPIQDLVMKATDEIQEMADGKTTPAWSTGIDRLDEILNGGLRAGEVVCLAARPSIGKSSLSNAIALAFAHKGLAVVDLSMEMPKRQCTLRLLSTESGIDLNKLKTGQMNDIEWTIFSETVERVARLPIFIDDEPALTIAAIQGKVGARRREGPKLLVVDFIQECSGEGIKGENRDRELGKIMQGLKTIAKRMSMAVLVLSQLNRDVENRASPEPTMRDLRDSGSLEQSSDIVVFLWTHARYAGYRVIGCAVAKNRDGENQVRFAMEFAPKCQRWSPSDVDVSPRAKPAATGGTTKNYVDTDM